MVEDILQTKGKAVWSLAPQATMKEALHVLAEKNIGALIVLDEGKVVGILSERDIVRQMDKEGHCDLEMPVSKLMTREVITVGSEKTLDACMKLMTLKHIRHLPVVDEGTLVGVISIGDVVRWVIDDQLHKINDLEKFISGNYSR
ncbi:MAG TPA: CBS domain-containing protein [Anaerolinea sp.]|nr:CBS domain-containing protein [Anaerolinea sp.]